MDNNGIIAREGYPFIAYSVGLTVLLTLSAWKLQSVVLAVPAAISFLLTLFVISFFRNPERTPPGDEQAGCRSGRRNGDCRRAGPRNTAGHVKHSRSASSCRSSMCMSTVPHLTARSWTSPIIRGRFLDARDGRASSENERNGVVLETAAGVRIAFVQIAGLIARRIICYPKVGDVLERGKRYGLIRFGSRVDVYLPVDVEPLVKLGDTTTAGETVLGRLG